MRGAAAKKKQRTNVSLSQGHANGNHINGGNAIHQIDEREYTSQIEKIKNGTHEELLRRKIAIEKEVDKKIAAADRFRKLQIKNIHELYEYEVNVLQTQREKLLSEVEEKLTHELQSQLESHKLRPKQSKTAEASNASDQIASERALRSVTGGANKDLDWSIVLKEEKKSSSRKRAANTANAMASLEKALEEKDVRADFLEIIQDLEARATRFKSNPPNSEIKANTTTILFPVVKIDSVGRLLVNENIYKVGDNLEIYSVLSDENFTGIITVIDSEEIILRSESGPRFSFPIHTIKSGRVILKSNLPIKDDLETNHLIHKVKLITAPSSTSETSTKE